MPLDLTKLLQFLSMVALLLEVFYRAVLALINAIRLMVSPEARAEATG